MVLWFLKPFSEDDSVVVLFPFISKLLVLQDARDIAIIKIVIIFFILFFLSLNIIFSRYIA